jgi:hypothetical protein
MVRERERERERSDDELEHAVWDDEREDVMGWNKKRQERRRRERERRAPDGVGGVSKREEREGRKRVGLYLNESSLSPYDRMGSSGVGGSNSRRRKRVDHCFHARARKSEPSFGFGTPAAPTGLGTVPMSPDRLASCHERLAKHLRARYDEFAAAEWMVDGPSAVARWVRERLVRSGHKARSSHVCDARIRLRMKNWRSRRNAITSDTSSGTTTMRTIISTEGTHRRTPLPPHSAAISSVAICGWQKPPACNRGHQRGRLLGNKCMGARGAGCSTIVSVTEGSRVWRTGLVTALL